MEKLQSLLSQYNNLHINQYHDAPWSTIYCNSSFPKYWQFVYSFLESKSRSERILEVGTGLGDVVAIGCYLKFSSICGIERDKNLALLAQRKIKTLFGLDDIIHAYDFPGNRMWNADILIMVNCVYCEGINSKEEYLNRIKFFYNRASKPKCFIFESISSDYKEIDPVFPEQVRLRIDDVFETFSDCNVQCFDTYKFPQNKTSKKIFLIERRPSIFENINSFL